MVIDSEFTVDRNLSHSCRQNVTMPADALNTFHPAVAGWFRSRFPEPTEAQARAWAKAFARAAVSANTVTLCGCTSKAADGPEQQLLPAFRRR